MFIINIIEEYYLIFRNKLLGFIRPIPEKYKSGNKGDIVIIIGINESWYFLKFIADYFNKNGYRIHFPEFKTRDSILRITQDVINYINNNKLENFFIITHSKGGLVARLIIENTTLKINQIYNVSVPNNGSIFGYLYLINLKEMKPNSSLINRINKSKTDKIVNIYSKFDNLVIPNYNLKLTGAINKQIDIIGHTRILESNQLLKYIEKLIMIYEEKK